MHTIRREIVHYAWTKIVAPGILVTLHHTCNHPSTYVCQRAKAWKQEYNIQWHFSLLILTSKQNLYVMMVANNLWKCNLQRLGNNVHLVMCHTKNALVKWNSVATLNPTWAHFVMFSQKVITYCCKNIHPQVHLSILYTHHMLIAQLPRFIQ
jgi:hypothetical protein